MPRFHRAHHGVLSVGSQGQNYAVLFPVWDSIFGTANFHIHAYPNTGDPAAPEALATGNWLEQQWVGLKRLLRRPPSA